MSELINFGCFAEKVQCPNCSFYDTYRRGTISLWWAFWLGLGTVFLGFLITIPWAIMSTVKMNDPDQKYICNHCGYQWETR